MDLYLLFDHAAGFVLYECKDWKYINESPLFIETFAQDEDAFLAAVKFKAFHAYNSTGEASSATVNMFCGIIPDYLDAFLKVNISSAPTTVVGTYSPFIAADLCLKGYLYHCDEGILALMRGCIRFGLFTFTDGLAKLIEKLAKNTGIRQEDASTNATKIEAFFGKQHTHNVEWLTPTKCQLNVSGDIVQFLESCSISPDETIRQNEANQRVVDWLNEQVPTLSIVMGHMLAYELMLRVNSDINLSKFTNKRLLEIAGSYRPDDTETKWDQKKYFIFGRHPLALMTPAQELPRVTLELARLCRACGTIDKLRNPYSKEFGRAMLKHLEQLVTSFKTIENNNNLLKAMLKAKIARKKIKRSGSHGRQCYTISCGRVNAIEFV